MRCMVEQTLDENDDLKQKHSRFLEIENVNPFMNALRRGYAVKYFFQTIS